MKKFIELNDGSIVNVDDIALMNVDRDMVRYVEGEPVYTRKLYIKNAPTLRLSEEDYVLLKKHLVETDN